MASNNINIKIGTQTYVVTGAASEDTLSKIEDLLKKATGQGGVLDGKNVKAVNDNFKVMTGNTDDLNESFEDLVTATDDVDDTFDKMIKTQKQRDQQSIKDSEYTSAAISQTVRKFGADTASSVVSISKTLIRDLQGNDSPEQLISTMAGVIDQAISVVSEAVGSLAELIPIFGLGVAGLTKAGADSLKFLNDFLGKEFQTIIGSYNKIGDSGIILARGMTDLKTAAADAGMGVDTFAAALQKNADNFRQSGLGMTAGAMKFSSVMTELQKNGGQYSKQLFELGFSTADQADLVSSAMANLARTTNLENVSAQEIASLSLQYAKSLRLISDLTGKSAEEQRKEQEEQRKNIALQAELQKLGPNAQRTFEQGIATLPKQMQTAVTELLGPLHSITDQQAAYFYQNDANFRKVVDNFRASVESNTPDPNIAQETAQNLADYNKSILNNKDAITLSTVSMYGASGAGADLGKAYNDLKQDVLGFTDESVKAAAKALDQLTKHVDPLTESSANLEVTLNNFNKEMAEIALKSLPEYAQVISRTATDLSTAVKDTLKLLGLGGNENADTDTNYKGKPPKEEQKDQSTLGKFFGSMWYQLKNSAGNYQESGQSTPTQGYANGGISSGPTTGYTALLHGTEAIVPLPDGKNIPVSIETPDYMDLPGADTLNKNLDPDIIKPKSLDKDDHIQNTQKTNALFQTLLDSSNNNNEYMQQIVKLMISQGGTLKDLAALLDTNNTLTHKIVKNSY
jgi:hypothetical protein